MRRRELLGTIAAAGALAAQSRPAIQRKGRIKQGLWTSNFGETNLSFEQLCAEAARLGAHGFDMRPPAQWPIMGQHGLVPTLDGTGGVNFKTASSIPKATTSWSNPSAPGSTRSLTTTSAPSSPSADNAAV